MGRETGKRLRPDPFGVVASCCKHRWSIRYPLVGFWESKRTSFPHNLRSTSSLRACLRRLKATVGDSGVAWQRPFMYMGSWAVLFPCILGERCAPAVRAPGDMRTCYYIWGILIQFYLCISVLSIPVCNTDSAHVDALLSPTPEHSLRRCRLQPAAKKRRSR